MFKWLDSKIILLFQIMYDFIWNKFGVTRGILSTFCLCTIMVYMYILEFSNPPPWISLLIILTCINFFLITTEYRDHNLQLNAEYEVLNIEALEAQDNFLDRITRLVLILLMIMGPFFKTLRSDLVIYNVALITALYLRTVMFRDREVQREPSLVEANNG